MKISKAVALLRQFEKTHGNIDTDIHGMRIAYKPSSKDDPPYLLGTYSVNTKEVRK